MKTRLIPRILFLLLAALSTEIPALLGIAQVQETASAGESAKESPEAHLGLGYDALREDKYEAAAAEFRAALQLDPTLVLRARFPLAVALFELHKPEEARHELEEVRRETGDHPNVLYYLGRLDLEERKFDSAIKDLTKAAAKPPFPDTAYYLGFAYFKHGDLAAAEKWLNEAAKLNPHDARALYQLGFVYRKEGKEELAKKTLADSEDLRKKEDNESVLKTECGKKLDQGAREDARRFCEQLYVADDPEKLTALGTIYGQHGDLEAALKPFQKAAQLQPQSPQMQYNLALVYYQMNRFEQARAPLDKALARWPDLFQLNALYGAVLLKLGEDLPGYRALHHAHELNPQDSATEDSLYKLTLALAHNSANSKQYSASLKYLKEAAALRPQQSEPHRIMAEIYTLTSHPAEASSEQREAERLGQNGPN